MRRYNPKDIEPKWQKKWAADNLYVASDFSDKPKYYALEYFPYPSGVTMHVGHVRNYAICDTYSRYKRMQGYNVLHPMGWDAFGLPAENYAIKTGVAPRQSTDENIKIFKRQLTQVGLSYDWSREIDSSKPDYYKWTQWLFTQFFKHKLAYKAEAPVNWCPKDKTVLANEQVIKQDGKNVCERCGTEVEKRNLSQWFLKITDYADRLMAGLEDLDWPEGIKAMQRNWIGKSQGAEIDFAVGKDKIRVFTTRPDTLFGATFMVMAPEHPLIGKITTADHKANVNRYIKATQGKTEIERQDESREKTGVFSGAYATNPVNGEKIPIWIADYVLMGYGTGAIMAVPAHDQRDYEFARKYDIKVVPVIEPQTGEVQGDEAEKDAIVAIVRNPKTDKLLMLNWGPRRDRWGGNLFIGGGLETGEDPVECARREILEETGYKNVRHIITLPQVVHSYYFSNVKNKNYYARMRGVLFELENEDQDVTKLDEGEKGKFEIMWVNQAKASELVNDDGHRLIFEALIEDNTCYSGEGVMINSGKYDGMSSSEARDKIVADLTKKGLANEKVNYRLRDWLISRQRYWGAPIPIVYCKKDGVVAVPEADLPVELPHLDSYEPSDDGRSPLSRVPEFVHTTCPVCKGPAERETDTMDTFVDSSWYFLRFTDPHNNKRPFETAKANYWLPVDAYVGGAEHAVAHLLFARFWTKFLFDRKMIGFEEPFKTLRNQGMIGGEDGRKMGKRYGNVVTPDDIIEQGYGADALRVFELFIAPYDQATPWNSKGVPGAYRFLQRVWVLAHEFLAATNAGKTKNSAAIDVAIHQAIKRVSEDLQNFSLNTAVASMMECTNTLYKIKAEEGFDAKNWQFALNSLVQLLAPFAPHIAEELWEGLGNKGSVHVSDWPVHDEKLLVQETVTIVVQVNSKVRAKLKMPAGSSEVDVLASAKEDKKVSSYIKDKDIKQTIYVPNKLLNIVVNQ